MNITDILVQAKRAIDDANISDDLRPIAFSKALDMLAQAALGTASSRPSTSSEAASSEPTGHKVQLNLIARKLNVDLETVSQIYDIENGELILVIPPGKLPSASAGATKEIALLVAAGYQGAGIHDWTPANLIRRWCEEYKKLDSPNFASTIKEMENTFSFKGGPRNRELRMTRTAWERATELVRRLSGADGG